LTLQNRHQDHDLPLTVVDGSFFSTYVQFGSGIILNEFKKPSV